MDFGCCAGEKSSKKILVLLRGYIRKYKHSHPEGNIQIKSIINKTDGRQVDRSSNEGPLAYAPYSSNRDSLPKTGMGRDVLFQFFSILTAGYRTHAMPMYGLPAIFPLIMILAQT
jgi:hypothetical protein